MIKVEEAAKKLSNDHQTEASGDIREASAWWAMNVLPCSNKTRDVYVCVCVQART